MARLRDPGHLLVVDDEENMRAVLQELLEREGYQVDTAADVAQGLAHLESGRHAAVLSDLRMPGRDGLSFLGEVSERWPGLPFVLLTAHGTIENAVDAMRQGAFDFITKPFAREELLAVVGRACGTASRSQREVRAPRGAGTELIGESPPMRELRRKIEKVAATPSNVLILGETGTGKELVARALHEGSERCEGPFVATNCAAIPETLVEAELFGHAKGAFSGAVSARPGRFESADGGTLFLDELGDMATDVQPKLLRAIEQREVQRVGESQTRKVDVRFVAATHPELRQRVERGEFRRDLYYRLSVVVLDLAPLRERREDVPLLVEHLLRRQAKRLGVQYEPPDRALLDNLMAYDYPGNVRELENLLEGLLVMADRGRLSRDDLPAAVRRVAPEAKPLPAAADAPDPEDEPASLKERVRGAVELLERQLIQEALRDSGWQCHPRSTRARPQPQGTAIEDEGVRHHPQARLGGRIGMSGRHQVAFEIDGCEVTLETGAIARQADAAVIVRCRRAVVLVTVVRSRRESDPGFLPLTVEYREKFAAAGAIPGGFLRREGRIRDDEVLASRILDRSIRPLFPKHFHDEVQVQATVLSAEPRSEEEPVLALLGACAALHLSALPWDGPLAGVRVVSDGESWRAFPMLEQRRRARADLVVSAGPSGLVMVEGGLDELPESDALEGLRQAQTRIARIVGAIEELRQCAGVEKESSDPPAATDLEQQLVQFVAEQTGGELGVALDVAGKTERRAALNEVQRRLQERASENWPDAEGLAAMVSRAFERAVAGRMRERVLAEGKRVDGRRADEIRAIESVVDWLPSPHGSAIFTRGETQALVTCTLAAERMEQRVETLRGMETIRFLLHYNFPPYSVGETRPLRGPGRREIGHGALARRALEAVVPSPRQFPYVVRVESEISESNGSSSMATVCGGCLAMMDAGVPLRSMVAGIAMGLISDGERTSILSDIVGDEDHLGDMDFKVAGSERGITALQMDNKLGALPEEVLERALEQARRGRLHILGEMKRALSEPRRQSKPHVPRIHSVPISVPSLGDLIGPRGAHLRAIEEEHGVQVSVDEAGGRALVYAADEDGARAAARAVRRQAGVVQEGKLYRGVVTSVKDFGAFVQIYKSAEGLVHISEWDESRVEDLSRQTKPGDEVVVRVLGVERGKLRLSRAAALGAAGEDVVDG